MHRPISILIFIVVPLLISCDKQFNYNQTINPLLGDISFVSTFGFQPTETTDEDLRIKTHLSYVENLLRQKDVSNLPEDLKEKRNYLLDLLHDYWTSGTFPRNYDYSNTRTPCFIDKNGRICAVGYLVEQTVGREIAEQINSKHKYDKLLAMNDELVDNWIATSGLTKEECAMIQPAYSPPPAYNYNYITPEYGISSAILGGLNLSLNTINAIQINKPSNNKTVPIISLLTGAGSIIYGAVNFPKNDWSYGMYANTNESQKTLSMLNIGLGTTTMILSVWNLAKRKDEKPLSFNWQLYSFPSVDKQPGLGLYFTKKM